MPQVNAGKQIIIQVVGYKNTGKTTMVCRLTDYFSRAGYTVGTIKHDAHSFEMDTPGTDTWKHQAAGAHMTAISSANNSAILYKQSLTLEKLIQAMEAVDIILIEGFKAASYPKIVLLRSTSDFELLATLDNPIAAALWTEAKPPTEGSAIHIPTVNIDDMEKLIKLILQSPRP